MGDTEKLDSYGAKETNSKDHKNRKLPMHLAGISSLFWIILFFGVVIPYLYRLPNAKHLDDVGKNEFIAERAYKDLYTLSNIGNKLVGTRENEVLAVEFLLKELNQIKEDSLKDYFDMEIDLSQASGQFIHTDLISVYKGVQNIAVKLTPRSSRSDNCLLVNSHFDSKPFTFSAGDAGFMVVVMLETLRTMATTKQTFDHPIVFLFNGAEECHLLAAHGFMDSHRWAKQLKAVVNLDAGGSNGREVLFQSGPNHSWLLNYYYKYAKHPFGTNLAEEIFQSGIVPSDTDFSIFKNYMPGLDMVQIFNGYIYHTKYDVIDLISHESIQNTGNNVLSLVRGLSNATELHNTEAHKTGNAVFFDFLGICFFNYPESTGRNLNFGVAAAALALIFFSMWRMATNSQISVSNVICSFTLVLIVQIISFVLGLALPIIVAYVFDAMGLSLVYYSTPFLIIGLYVCPSLIGLALPITIYYSLQKNDKISSPYHLQLSLHSQSFILSLLVIGFTMMGIRSSYIFMIPVLCYDIFLIFSLVTPLHDRGYSWTGLLKLSQIIPFLYSSYLIYLFIVILTPMGARAGSASNRDLYIAGLAAVGTVLSFGFLVPLINSFRRPSFVIYCLIAITGISMFLASSTELGFPYRARTSGQRVAFLHTRNRFYEYDGTLSKDESGYLFLYQDRRKETSLKGSNVNLTGLESIGPRCERHMMCGLPLYDFRYVQQRMESKFMTRFEPIEIPGNAKLEMLNKTVISPNVIRFEFNLTGPPQMSLFFRTYDDVKITDWPFLKSYLENPPAYPLSYHIYLNYGIDSSPWNFFIELEKQNGDFNVPLCEVGVSAHYIGKRDEPGEEFAKTFPSFAILADWPASYDRFIY